MPRPRPFLRHLRLLLAASCLSWTISAPVQAQLLGGLPQAPMLPVPPVVDRVVEAPRELASRAVDPLVRQLVRRHPDLVALDPQGAAIVRNELVAIDPGATALALARSAGFEVVAEHPLEELGLDAVVLRAPRGLDTARALARLRRIDPQGIYEFNHLYFGSGAAAPGGDGDDAPAAPSKQALRIGLIDSGVLQEHPALRDSEVRAWGCQGTQVPGAHGTAVASLLAAGTLYSADIYCGRPDGGSATAFAAAMAWLAREQVPVVNISLVGPDNALLRRATAAMLARGHVLVSAVGNEGPAAEPLFPAAYDGVIGVTGVDARSRALPEALRGEQVDFAAPGNGLRAADLEGGWHQVRGTSFAAPLVARAAAVALAGSASAPGEPAAAASVRDRLASDAVDLGDPGRDDTYGHGLVARLNGS